MKRCLRFFFVLPVLLAVTVGCGYHRVGFGNNVPGDIHKVAVPVFRNDSYEPGIEVTITNAFREEIIRSGFVKLSPVKDADAVVMGIIKKFKVKPISFSSEDFAVEYRATLTMHLRLVSRTGVILWEDRNFFEVEDYRVSPDIFESEAARQAATVTIARKIMADVHDRIFDGFPIGNVGNPVGRE